MIFLSSPKDCFLQSVLIYKIIIFEKVLNSNFAYGICVIFKDGKSAFFSSSLLIKNLKEFYKSNDF